MNKPNAPHRALSEAEIKYLKLFANTIRGLAMDGVQAANSGHPGLPLGMADAAAVLWARHLRHHPDDPHWPNRDRFVLSGGHGSMLIYSLLHLTGYPLALNELKHFRQWGSKTPGHPEYGHTVGIETTTGPLGQGISNAVGMAIAEKWLAQRFNRPDLQLIQHHTYVIASDGDLMEGVSHEACSLAGHLKLGRLIVLYDDNHISIDGSTGLSFSEDVLKRFEAYGWHTQRVDGHDHGAVDAALQAAQTEEARPSIIACRTVIGYGSPNRAGTSKAHGEPLGEEELRLTKQQLGWPESPAFYIPDEIASLADTARENGRQWQEDWQRLFERYRQAHPEAAAQFDQMRSHKLPENWEGLLPDFPAGKDLATRAASGAVLNALSPIMPGLIGGSADLTPSNNTFPKNETAIAPDDFSGRYLHFGVREHGMGAIMSGLALHGEFIPYGGTFMVFSDYMRGSIRLAALMGIQVIYVFTHDSIGLGEDGPTHQPVEHLAALRAIPNLMVIRPADAAETAQAWRMALLHRSGPTVLALTRQKLPVLERSGGNLSPADGLQKGAYVVLDQPSPEVILIASGSELHIALEAAGLLANQQIHARVVSLPCSERFDAQPASYRHSVLPPQLKPRVTIEAGSTLGWHQYAGECGEIVGLERFGASAPYQDIYQGLNLTAEAVAAAARRSIAKVSESKG